MIIIANNNEPEYLATIIFDTKSNDKKLLIKDYETNKQIEYNIDKTKGSYADYKAVNRSNKEVGLHRFITDRNIDSLIEADKRNESISFILNDKEINNLQKFNFIYPSKEVKLANFIEIYEERNGYNKIEERELSPLENDYYEDIEVDHEINNYHYMLERIKSGNDVEIDFHSSDIFEHGSYEFRSQVNVKELSYHSEATNLMTGEKKEEVILFDSLDDMIDRLNKFEDERDPELSLEKFMDNESIKSDMIVRANDLLSEYGYESEITSFKDEKAQEFVKKYNGSKNENEQSLQEKWSIQENKYYEINNNISPDRLNAVTESLVKNNLDFDKALSNDVNNNRVVTLLQSDKELLKHSVDHLQRSKMYALLSSAKNELADVRIKSDSLDSERETILVDKITDLESRVVPPLKATLENVNAKINTASNVRATANALQNVQIKTKVHENTIGKEPVLNSIKKTSPAELSR